MKKHLYHILIIFNTLFYLNATSQTVLQYPSVSSDIGLNITSNKNTNLYNGLPEIIIPIHEIKFKHYTHPITLSYHAGGNKPNFRSGIVGLGWNMNAGGQITRIKNSAHRNETGIINSYENKINRVNWNESAILTLYTNDAYTPYLDEFVVNVGNINGSFYVYKNSLGKIETKTKSKNGVYFKVIDIEIGKLPPLLLAEDSWYVPHMNKTYSSKANFEVREDVIKKIKIQDANGVIYTFGGNTESIELYGSHNIDPDYYQYYDIFYEPRNPSSPRKLWGDFKSFILSEISTWHITNITTPLSDEINFRYKKYNPNLSQTLSAQKYNSANFVGEGINYDAMKPKLYPQYIDGVYWGMQIPDSEMYKEFSLQFISSSHLVEIFTSNYDRYVFMYSKRNDYNDNYSISWFVPHNDNVGGLQNKIESTNNYYKLDEIYISDLKRIKFNYIENSDERLKLKVLNFRNALSDNLFNYKFSYNSLLLPNEKYCTRKTDNWGFFNDKDYREVIEKGHYDKLYEFRQPDALKMKAEILESITYPTGGKSYFEFEPHTYSKVANQYPFTISNKTGTAGGLRVSKIKYYDDESNKYIVKNYSYENEDKTSSGILSNEPKYTISGKGSYNNKYGTTIELNFNFNSEYNINWFNDNHITYSRVIEKISDGSKVIHKFSNYDEIQDEPSCGEYNPNSSNNNLYKRYSSRSLDRGSLVSRSYYDNKDNIIRKEEYKYNSDLSNYIKAIDRYAYMHMFPIRISANKIYCFHPYLKEEKITDYTNKGIVTTLNKYNYNEHRLLTESQKFNGNILLEKVNYKYPHDFKTQAPYNKMVENNMLAYVINKNIQYSESNIKEIIGYRSFSNTYLPSEQSIQYNNSNIQNKIKFLSYDKAGNPTSIIDEKGINIVYLWGYNKKYIIAEIKNAEYQEVSNALGESFINLISNGENLSNSELDKLNKLRINPSLKKCMISTFTYLMDVGMLSATDASGITTYYEYDEHNRLKNIKNSNKNLVESYIYNYQNK